MDCSLNRHSVRATCLNNNHLRYCIYNIYYKGCARVLLPGHHGKVFQAFVEQKWGTYLKGHEKLISDCIRDIATAAGIFFSKK